VRVLTRVCIGLPSIGLVKGLVITFVRDLE
jgi:hypothetical protein